jgi:hypothetical protein
MRALADKVNAKEFGACSDAFVASMKEFIGQRANEQEELMASLRLIGRDISNPVPGGEHVVKLTNRVTKSQLKDFFDLCTPFPSLLHVGRM